MKPGRLLLTCLFSFLLILGLGSAATAQTITLEATTESGAVPTGFVAGQNLQLYIQVDDADGIAGAAFTLFYPSAMLTAPVTNVDGVPQVTGEIDSFFPFMYVNPADAGDTTDTWRTNTAETGRIYFSGAAIDTSDGGAQYDTTGSKDLFVVTFTVKEGVALGTIADAFTLEQTELFNPAAGYGIDVGGDGSFDDGVDSTGLVPVLVGALSTADTTGPVDGFGGDLSDDFPILLDENGLTNGLIASLDLNIIDGYAISGTVGYSGNQTGTLKVGAFDVADTGYTTPIGGQEYSWPAGTTSQAFTLSVPPNGSYFLAAFIDDGDDVNEDFEPWGEYTTQIDIVDGDDTTTRIFSLTDPLDETTGEPLYYVNWAGGYGTIGLMADDSDRDGYSNIQELLNGTDPTSQDAAGGDGYDESSDARIAPCTLVGGLLNNMIVQGPAFDGTDPAAEHDWICAIGPGGADDVRAVGQVDASGDYFLVIGSDANGEEITFELHRYVEGDTVPAAETIDFLADDTQVDFALHFGGQQSIGLITGWNWVSFNVLPPDTTPAAFFGANVGLVSQIKTQTKALINVGGNWVGNADTIDQIANGAMFKIKTTAGFTLDITGTPVAANLEIPLVNGWTWVAYLPTAADTPQNALGSIIADMTQVKSQTQALINVGGNWIGTLTNMSAGGGYKINMSTNATLIYPQP